MNKLNSLILNWEKGTVKSTKELNKMGYSSQLLKSYATYGWLSLVGRGAYKLSNDQLNWYGGLYCIQQQNQTVHVGGKTALAIKGFTHYVAIKPQVVDLFGKIGDKLPNWFTNQSWMDELKFYTTNNFDYSDKKLLIDSSMNNIKLKISTPELAILEMLFLVPHVYSFDEAFLITESLLTLNPDTLQKLLDNCNSVKIKRLLLYFGEKHNHFWFNELNQTRIDLGSGKRQIVENGKLNKRYNITVPREYYE